MNISQTTVHCAWTNKEHATDASSDTCTSLTWLQAANFYRGITFSPMKKLRHETSKFMYIIDRINVCHAAADLSSLNIQLLVS